MKLSNGATLFYAYYTDDEDIVKAAHTLTERGVKIRDAYSPYPVHGLYKAMGLKWTRLGRVAFIYAMLAMGTALLGCWYFMIYDWPMIIGGKPNHTLFDNLPSFVPIIFEFTVFCTAHLTALTFLLRSKILPGVTPRNPHPSTTIDTFALEIHYSDNKKFSLDELLKMIEDTQPTRISTSPERPEYGIQSPPTGKALSSQRKEKYGTYKTKGTGMLS